MEWLPETGMKSFFFLSEHLRQGGGQSKASSYQGWGAQCRQAWYIYKHTLWKQKRHAALSKQK